VLLDQLAKWGAHRSLVHTGTLDVTGKAVQLRARRVLGTDALEPCRTAVDDGRNAAEGLHVVDDGGLSKETDDCRERRPRSGLRPLAFDGLEQRGLLPADVRARAAEHVDLA